MDDLGIIGVLGAFFVEQVKVLKGPLAINSLLNNAERLYEGLLDAPEHIIERNKELYVSLRTNEVVKIADNKIKTIVNFGKSCYNAEPYELIPCGRPLGMNFDTLGNNLIVMHSYDGIYEVNLDSGDKKLLVSRDTIIGKDNPRTCKLFNSVAVAKNGDIYFTHSSSEYEIDKVMQTGSCNPSGRLIKFSRDSKKLDVLVDKLWFANGLVISPNEDFIIFAESHRQKLSKHWIAGEKKGQTENFLNLPGAPDNLSSNKNGFLIAMPVIADENHPLLTYLLAPRPLIRKFLARFFELTLMPFKFVNSIYPNPITINIVNKFGTMDMLSFIIPKHRAVIHVDWNGNILKTYHGTDDSTASLTHAIEIDNYLYLGSVVTDYIGRVQIKNDKN
ncbi:hypothetical protein PVAND_008770 [Polypedilum vanderplanki]|uniref:Strictosidine synthase conserved region domain-containing protein n=1 Tax=Polypedilum vanderplanki TaxID=319348 RepID=A0A9J6CBA1_POLVA|nr:hypothetical protein PVAND_008770 [Polypedilum vanderplanki]